VPTDLNAERERRYQAGTARTDAEFARVKAEFASLIPELIARAEYDPHADEVLKRERKNYPELFKDYPEFAEGYGTGENLIERIADQYMRERG